MKKMTLLAMALTMYFGIAGATTPGDCCGQGNDTTQTIDDSAAKMVRNQLIGQWQNNTYAANLVASDMEGTFLRYEFARNGSFIKTAGDSQSEEQMRGQWELSNDGHRLMLYPDGCLNPEVIGIKYLDLDELVLEQSPENPDDDINVIVKDIFYNRM
ncbi:MAG TPA: hypothetical protein PKE06_06305 [Flavilitoribacter sp.]|nr:hypothetical protein [Flavilitoribacter sp.]HMQ85989.1 hypothetical protein [Flavilitoribacter sp.]